MDEYGDMLLRTACLLLKDRQTAEEAVQDTFIQAYAKIGQLQHPEHLKSWLIRIVINRCRMRQRTWSWRNIFPAAQPVDPLSNDPVTVEAAEELFIKKWQHGQLTEAVRSLNYLYRECVVLYYFHDMSIREISAQLDTAENTIKSRLSRGRQLLKKALAKEEPLR